MRNLLLASVLAAGLTGIALKLPGPAAMPAATTAPDLSWVRAALGPAFRELGEAGGTRKGHFRILEFEGRGCRRRLYAMALSSSAEGASVLGSVAAARGYEVRYILDGESHPRYPSLRFVLSRAAARLRGSNEAGRPVLMVAASAPCEGALAPWEAAETTLARTSLGTP